MPKISELSQRSFPKTKVKQNKWHYFRIKSAINGRSRRWMCHQKCPHKLSATTSVPRCSRGYGISFNRNLIVLMTSETTAQTAPTNCCVDTMRVEKRQRENACGRERKIMPFKVWTLMQVHSHVESTVHFWHIYLGAHRFHQHSPYKRLGQ